jgi:hypothetical protein
LFVFCVFSNTAERQQNWSPCQRITRWPIFYKPLPAKRSPVSAI